MPATLVVSGRSIFFWWLLPERAVFFILGGPKTGVDPGISIFVEEGFADPKPILEATPPPGVAAGTLIACGDEPPVSVFFFFLGGGALPPLVDLTLIATAGCCS